MRLFREMPATMETASTGTLKVEARDVYKRQSLGSVIEPGLATYTSPSFCAL